MDDIYDFYRKGELDKIDAYNEVLEITNNAKVAIANGNGIPINSIKF
ncbi:hypothetical protein GCM10011344_47610 [Dokdonia pacifica]|uniref:Uncharacterized protein n=1 Tax=Dokdonia pacifica TaxID=1627892 RepID=A0A239DUJ9_9FLAO|nr:hypothetical protein [Dokdonia pacifica]GGG41201.1 hypothetical protein GCM10011344_47610 [Dokdonia pacifica]SNS36017.1 hypothetical protein SAMN06265376_11265 [Dokdonia pacifica]